MEIRDTGTADIFNGRDTKVARKTLPTQLWKKARLQLDRVNQATVLQDLAVPPSNNLHALKAPRAGMHAIAINDQFRIVFTWTKDGAADVHIIDYH